MGNKQRTREQLLFEVGELRKELDSLWANATVKEKALGILNDLISEITEGKRVEEELRESEEKYRSLVESTDDSIYLVDSNYRYLFINKKHLSRLGLGLNQVLGMTYGDIHTTEETAEFVRCVDKVFITGESGQHEHLSNRDSGYFLRTMSPVKDQAGNIRAVTIVSKDITSLKAMEAELYALSLTDDLTAVYNRRGFLALADQQMKIAKRMQTRRLLIYIDVNGLKGINDTFGHAYGDAALQDLATVLRGTFRESDIIARIGGDEFVVLITELVNGCATTMYLNRLNLNIERFNRDAKRPYSLCISAGAVSYDPSTPCTIEELLSSGDRQMYAQKSKQRPPS